ncbi:MAG: sulfatase-like hydrolase/transferase [bacterium]
MKRREFLQSAGLGSAGLFLSRGARAAERPNILFVLVDQERYPLHDDPVARPQRDRLSETAVKFQNHYAVFPLCSPSRASLMTGRYPHEFGINANIYADEVIPELPRDVPNLGNVFADAGYQSAYFGKWHLSHHVKNRRTPKKYGFSGRISNERIAIGSDPLVAREAAFWMRTHADQTPWFMVCSLINPHDICYPPFDPLYPSYSDKKVSVPPNLETDLSDNVKAVQMHPENNRDRYGSVGDDWKGNLEYYHDLIMDADKNLGVLLDALEDTGQADNTIVVFTSDHGEMAGSHGLLNKGLIYEEASRVPLWISVPGSRGPRDRNDLTSHLDFVPTLCGLAGVEWPRPLAGRDLKPGTGEDAVEPVSHVFMEGSAGDLADTIPWRGLCTGEWKYALFMNGEEQLFYLPEDPLELKNLARTGDAAAEKKRFRKLVNDWRRETGDTLRGEL